MMAKHANNCFTFNSSVKSGFYRLGLKAVLTLLEIRGISFLRARERTNMNERMEICILTKNRLKQ